MPPHYVMLCGSVRLPCRGDHHWGIEHQTGGSPCALSPWAAGVVLGGACSRAVLLGTEVGQLRGGGGEGAELSFRPMDLSAVHFRSQG